MCVVNLDSMSYGSNPSTLDDFLHNGRYRFVRGDIADLDTGKHLIAEVDAIVSSIDLEGEASFALRRHFGTQAGSGQRGSLK